jgi:hypothetical protein
MNAAPLWLALVGPAIALAAFFRPDIMSWWKRRRADLLFKWQPRIEISLNVLGPTITITGVFVAKNVAHLIESVSLQLMHPDGKTISHFEWFLFREQTVDFEKPMHAKSELANPFHCLPLEVIARTIVFRNVSAGEKATESLVRLRDATQKMPTANKSNTAFALQPIHAQKRSLFFKEYSETYKEISQIFEWKNGAYNADLCIQAHDPKKNYKIALQFELSESDVSTVAVNIETACDIMLGDSQPIWNWAYPKAIRVGS